MNHGVAVCLLSNYSELNLNQYSVGSPCRTICTVCGSPPCSDLNLIHYISLKPALSGSLLRGGSLFPVQILYEGKPLAGATVTATADTVAAKDPAATHDHREPQAFSGKTDKQGKVNILPLVEGLWKIRLVHKTPFADPKVCGDSTAYATLIMPVGTARANAEPHHHHH